jgi:hypothetical protein
MYWINLQLLLGLSFCANLAAENDDDGPEGFRIESSAAIH